jgi:hypothetical protein
MPGQNRTLLNIINAAQQELGLPQASTVIGNTDTTTVQLLGFAQSELEELGKKHDWTALTFEYNLNINPPLETTGDTTEGSAVVTNIPDTSTLSGIYFAAIGDNIPNGARIATVDSATQVTLTMLATGTQTGVDFIFAQDTYPEPSDFDHFINQTWWDRTNRWSLLGPLSPQIDQWHLSGIVAVGPRRYFRQIGPFPNNYRIWPPPTEIASELQLVFEYQTQNRVRLAGSTTSFGFPWTNDTDIPLLDDRAIIMGIKWRFWEQKGFNWLSKRKEYDDYVERLISRDGAAPTLSLSAQPQSILISPANVQDGFFPGATGPNTS